MDVLQLVKQLISIKSITDSPDESKPIKFISKLLKKNNISYKIIGSGSKLNLVAEIGAGKKSILLNSHFDVVPGDELQFKPIIKGGRLYGRGSSDAKGPLASMIVAFLELSKRKLVEKVILCCVCDEENAGALGTKILAQKGISAKYHIFGEPTDFNIIIAEKGFLRLKIIILGKEAHAAFPENGENAIAKMSFIMQEILRIKYSTSHPLLSKPTVSFGIISGGQKVNIVAGRCELDIDIRYLPGQSKEEIIRRIKQIVNKYGKGSVEIISFGEPCETRVDSPLVQKAQKIYASGAVGVNFATDARFYKNKDFIVCGPGYSKLAHQKREYIVISQLYKAVKRYKEIVSSVFFDQ